MENTLIGYRDSAPYGQKGSLTHVHKTLESYKELLRTMNVTVKGTPCFRVWGEFARDEGGSDGLVLYWTKYEAFYL